MAENIIILWDEIGFEVEIFEKKCIVKSGMDAFYTVASSGKPLGITYLQKE
ncbi:hypothetical protein [Clostridium tagluense]|uniref:hypothetical protein n=1 Tax=Clostridium tagluense TaxID=360422 RepID=UPI00163A085A|nr:hypothetical protein [Clostridium tagluense]